MSVKQAFKAAAIAISVFGANTAAANPAADPAKSCLTEFLEGAPNSAYDPDAKKCSENDKKAIRRIQSIEKLLG